MTIKDWRIVKHSNGECRLYHNCNKGWYRTCKKEKNQWRCLNCKIIAPEDVELIANICYCENPPNLHKLYSEAYLETYNKCIQKMQKEMSPVYSQLVKDETSDA